LTTTSLAGSDPERARLLWVKLRCVQQFPMSYQELLFPGTVGSQTYIGADSTYAKRLAAVGITPLTYNNQAPAYPPALPVDPPPRGVITANAQRELATCLYIALTTKSHRGRTTQEDTFNADERGTYSLANGNSLPMIVDNWGQPLVFFRWPLGDSTFQSTAPKSAGTLIDPLDPTGRLADTTWSTAFYTLAEPAIKHSVRAGPNYLLPVVVSVGMDGDLGITDYYMSPATSGTAAGAANDNIYSYLLK
jgi:hypothetical protein